MDTQNLLYFKDRHVWRRWLEQHFASEREAWLVHYKKHVGVGISHAEAVKEALCFGWIDGILKSLDSEKFALRYSPRREKSVWSKINKDTATKMIALGKMTEAGLKAIETAKKNGQWQAAYTSLKKDRLPSDLKKVLMRNREAWKNFAHFATTYQNGYIDWVTGAKTSSTRCRRIARVVEHAQRNEKLIGGVYDENF